MSNMENPWGGGVALKSQNLPAPHVGWSLAYWLTEVTLLSIKRHKCPPSGAKHISMQDDWRIFSSKAANDGRQLCRHRSRQAGVSKGILVFSLLLKLCHACTAYCPRTSAFFLSFARSCFVKLPKEK